MKRFLPTTDTPKRCLDHLGAVVCAMIVAAALSAPSRGQDADAAQPADATTQEHENTETDKKSPLDRLRTLVDEATELYRSRDYEAAAQRVVAGQRRIAELRQAAQSSRAKQLLAPWAGRLSNLARRLSEKGVTLPAAVDGDGTGLDIAGTNATPTVSFVRDVVPVLLRRCGACHVKKRSGELSLASYADITRGGENGAVIAPGNTAESRLVDVLTSGEMPAKGTIDPAQIDVIARWVAAGAKFDGDDPSASIVALLGSTPRTPDATDQAANQPTDTPKVRLPTGDETVSFVRDLAPVLREQCDRCHGPQQSSADLRLDTFAYLVSGSEGGEIILPDDADGSLLIQKLRGEAGEQMPLDRAPLADEVIGRFVTWIDEGAAFDGGDTAATLRQLVDASERASLSHEELAERRRNNAHAAWRLAVPDLAAAEVQFDDLLLLGDRSAEELEVVAKMATDEMARARELLSLPADEPALHGRLTLFTFGRRFDYSEFGLMVESRDIPFADRAHWRVQGLDAYVCLALPASINADDEDLRARLCQQVTGTLLDDIEDLPAWFVAGSAREIAGRLHPQSSLVSTWRKAARQQLAESAGPSDLIDDELWAEDTAAVGQSLVGFMMTGTNRYTRLVELVSQDGQSFDAAVKVVYGRSLEDLVEMWSGNGGRRRR